MKRIILTFGLISGAIMSAMFVISMPFHDRIGFDNSMIVGYTSMVIAGLLIFFGVRQYRDTVGGGVVSFGRAFTVGMLISTVASLCYVTTWEVIYFGTGHGTEYLAKYRVYAIEKEKAKGATDAELVAKAAELDKYARWYQNPALNAAITFLEPLPVALVLSLLSAGLLRRRFAGTELSPRVAT